jgi:hypothetical protein
VAEDANAVDLPHRVGEELGDVLVGGPVRRHAEVVVELAAEGLADGGRVNQS